MSLNAEIRQIAVESIQVVVGAIRILIARLALRRVAGGVGIAVLTTSRGVLSDREAHAKNVGGEILCEVW